MKTTALLFLALALPVHAKQSCEIAAEVTQIIAELRDAGEPIEHTKSIMFQTILATTPDASMGTYEVWNMIIEDIYSYPRLDPKTEANLMYTGCEQ